MVTKPILSRKCNDFLQKALSELGTLCKSVDHLNMIVSGRGSLYIPQKELERWSATKIDPQFKVDGLETRPTAQQVD